MQNFENKSHSENDFQNDIQQEKKVVPVIEERVEVGKKVIEKAKVHVSKTVNEHIESYDIPLSSEEIVVKRVPKNELVDTVPQGIRYEGDTMIISVLKEVAVIEKRVMLVEEIHIAKYKNDKVETREVTVRKEEVHVERKEIIPPITD
jgi:stress response protein YsnF